jgi:hypothetical protein
MQKNHDKNQAATSLFFVKRSCKLRLAAMPQPNYGELCPPLAGVGGGILRIPIPRSLNNFIW